MADTEREAFEAWARSDDSPAYMSEDLTRDGDNYVRVSLDIGWKAWQASALASRPAEVDKLLITEKVAESMFKHGVNYQPGMGAVIMDLIESAPSHTTNKENG